MAAAPRFCDLLLDGSIKLTCFEPSPIAGHRSVLEAQIQTHLSLRSRHLRDRMFYREAEPPVPDRILGKATTLRAFPSNSCSNTRKALPEKRSDLPLRFSCVALKGIQPKARLEPRLGRQRSFAFLTCFRRVANSALIR
jgi:hypothetical protein